MTRDSFNLDDHFLAATNKSWNRVRLKTILSEVDERSPTGEEVLLGLSGSRGVLKRSEMGQRSSQASTYIGYKKVQPGQLIANKMQSWNGVFGVSSFDGITSPDYAIYEFAERSDTRFVEYSLRTKLFASEFLCRSRGIGTGFLRLHPREFLSTPFWLPSSQIKGAITKFLDNETARIDQLIEKKQRSIELVDEKRATLISAAVTGHLNFGSPQPKAIESSEFKAYTGKFPSSKCKRHLEIVLGKMLQPVANSKLDVLLPYIRAANVGWGQIDFTGLKEMWFSPGERRKFSVRPGDMIVLEGGDVGRAAMLGDVPCELGFQNSVHRVRARPGNDTRFSYYWMFHLHSSGYIDQVCSKATLAHFTREKFAEAPFPNVGCTVQREIAKFLDHHTSRIDVLKAKTQSSIDRLRELRASLITAAVTGQIDVATWGKKGQVSRNFDRAEAAT